MTTRGRGRGGRGRRGRGRGRGGTWRHPRDFSDYPPPPLIRPIFDWSEVGEVFPPASSRVDYSLLYQLLSKKVQEVTPSAEEQSLVQGLCTKVSTVMENMIVTGEGEELLLDEVRAVGPQKMGTSLAGNLVAELVVLLRDVPSALLVSKLASKVSDLLNSAHEDNKESGSQSTDDDGPLLLQVISSNAFELSSGRVVTRVYVTTTGDKVYGFLPREQDKVVDMKPFEDALRMIRHSKWWEDHTSHLKSVRSLVRILKDMQKHVPGLQHLESWCIQLLCNCAVIPLVGDEPLSIVDGFKRIWELLSAGLFLPGSIGIPDPCETTPSAAFVMQCIQCCRGSGLVDETNAMEGDHGIHENLPLHVCDELTRNSQMILQMLSFGAYREVLAMDGAIPIKFTESYSFGGVTLGVAAPACDKPAEDNTVADS